MGPKDSQFPEGTKYASQSFRPAAWVPERWADENKREDLTRTNMNTPVSELGNTFEELGVSGDALARAKAKAPAKDDWDVDMNKLKD